MSAGQTIRLVLFLAAAGLALSGCGRKGDLDAPGTAYPNKKPVEGTAEAAPETVDRPFILDPLL